MTTINQEGKENIGPVGLGGWLTLPIIGLFITPFVAVVTMVTAVIPCLEPEIWSAITTPGAEAYHPLWAPLLVFYSISRLILFIASIVLLVLLFRKKNVFPKLMIALYIFILLLSLVDLISVGFINTDMPSQILRESKMEATRSFVMKCSWIFIWVSYFYTSKRVNNTFVN